MKRHIVQTNIKQELYGYTVYVLVTQSCLTLCDPTDCSLSGSSVHGILQVRILEWVAISYSRDLPDPGVEPMSDREGLNPL